MPFNEHYSGSERVGPLLAVVSALGVWVGLAAAGPSGDVLFTQHIITTEATTVRGVAAADIDGDGDTDGLSADLGDKTVAWYENSGGLHPTFTVHVIADDRRGSGFVLAADINGDGCMDVLSVSGVDDTIAWYENDGGSPPIFTERVVTEDPDDSPDPDGRNGFADGPKSCFAADLDGDGDLDIGFAAHHNDRVGWFENDGGSPPAWTPWVLTDNLDGPRAAHGADLDGDGDVDIIAGPEYDDHILWFENDGASPPTFTEHVLVTFRVGNWPDEIATIWRIVAADIDGDGDIDVLAARKHDGIEWYENDGGSPPQFTRWIIDAGATPGKSVNAADVDGDGDIDVLAASAGGDKIAWYENMGGTPPVLIERVITEDPDGNGPQDGPADGARSVFPADFDGDGDIDILWGAKWAWTVAWEENLLIHDLTCPADLDGDAEVGILDLLLLLAAWGTDPGGPPDFDGDGSVGITDFLELLANWGPCP